MALAPVAICQPVLAITLFILDRLDPPFFVAIPVLLLVLAPAYFVAGRWMQRRLNQQDVKA